MSFHRNGEARTGWPLRGLSRRSRRGSPPRRGGDSEVAKPVASDAALEHVIRVAVQGEVAVRALELLIASFSAARVDQVALVPIVVVVK